MRNTLQEQYNLIQEGKGNKQHFFKSVRQLFPNLVTPINTYEDTVRILKNRGIITEGIGGVVTKGKTPDWHQIFKENITEAAKAEEKETTKEVTDMATRGYDYKDTKNYDNVFGQEFLKGFYTEMQDEKNKDKGVDELKAIVAKNLAKDINHYVKDGQFGLKGVGYTTEAPGLGTSKEPKGKHKASGYGDLKESVLRSQIYLLVKEVLAEGENKDLSKHRLGVLKTALAHAEKEIKTVDKDSKAHKEWEKTIAGKKAEIKALEKEVLSEAKFEVGDTVTYKGDKYEITRFIDDRIYIKSLKHGGRPDSWVKASDLQKEALAETSEAEFEKATDMIDAGKSVEMVAKMFPNINKDQLQNYKETKDRLETGDLD